MKLAFCLFRYFPYGGLQRDFMRIAEVCHKRGHEIHVYTMSWEGELAPFLHLHVLKPKGFQNHTRLKSFIRQVGNELAQNNYDVVVGFNKMPHLDVYYAADVCYQARMHEQRRWMNRLLPRYRQLVDFEKAVFAPRQKTQILLISALQQKEFVKHYQTEAQRFHLLPPGISKDRIAPENASEIRSAMRQQLGVQPDQHLLLMVGSGFKTKGLDRAIRGLAALPSEVKEKCRLFVVGQDRPAIFERLARELNVAHQLQFLGGRPDVPQILLAGDLLLHPAYHENTGTVLLEAVVAGLPVLTVENCGYAHYITQANAGKVLAMPFAQSIFNQTLAAMLLSDERQFQSQNGIQFANHADLYSMPEQAADLIEQSGHSR